MSLFYGELERQVIGINVVDAIVGLGVGYTIVAYHGCLDVGCTITYIGYRELNLGTSIAASQAPQSSHEQA